MIQLICVNVPEGHENFLTKGKIYLGEEGIISGSLGYFYSVTNDRGGIEDRYLKCSNPVEFIPKWCAFVKLEEWREIQLNKVIGLEN